MFERLSRRTQQLADSVNDRVNNLIKEYDRLIENNKQLRRELNSLKRDYVGLVSCPEVREFLNKEEIEKNEYINALLKEYGKTS
jgi:hypothetical protein